MKKMKPARLKPTKAWALVDEFGHVVSDLFWSISTARAARILEWETSSIWCRVARVIITEAPQRQKSK